MSRILPGRPRANILLAALCVAGGILGGLGLASLRADIDKDRQEKAPEEQKGKLAPNGESHEELHRRLAKEGEANLREIARLMEKIQKNLGKNDTGAATQESQQEVVKRLQELIDKLGKG